MAAKEQQGENTPSLLDRLIDNEPRNRDVRQEPAKSLRQLKAGLRRDLEWLLNARRPPVDLPEGAGELERSVFYYGLPDVSSLSLNSVTDQRLLVRVIETAVAAFEPRLTGVRVSLQPVNRNTQTMRFQIEGMFRIDPAPERVTFDTTLELISGEYEVEGERSAG
ncbi:MAG: type VI secretion system baseplate subunit TssE [Bryobacterales bacterium]|nr:type VI secretion system baseplate subunit TssE [Acidobacteriota bacterium]MCB9385575.1 type VI secretion system baseplate subunit TssE [Bryobacterales bacterium]